MEFTPAAPFGAISCSKTDLERRYPFAFYQSPRNIKHQEVNKWGLKMAAETRRRHNSKKGHEEWCKKEIHCRLDIAIPLADRRALAGNSQYFNNKKHSDQGTHTDKPKSGSAKSDTPICPVLPN